jgi:hypothetical protein
MIDRNSSMPRWAFFALLGLVVILAAYALLTATVLCSNCYGPNG